MADKYIRVSNKLHSILKLKSAKAHITMKTLVELFIWPMIKKENKVKLIGGKDGYFPHKKDPSGRMKWS